MGIFSGLKKLGLESLEEVDLFEDEKRKQEEKAHASAAGPVKLQEKDLIYDRNFVCPVCDSSFTAKMMKSGKAKLLGTDQDLRARYDGIDAVKYDVVLCPVCAYTALLRFFPSVTSTQVKLIREKISPSVKLTPYQDEVYGYEQAMERYKLALANALVKHAKTSEKAYICLKSAWLLRGYAEHLKETGEGDEKRIAVLAGQEDEFLENAYKGFSEARQNEMFPLCGMDTVTVDYLVGVLAIRFKDYGMATKLLSAVITAPGANVRIKDRARDMKDQLVKELKSK